MRIARIMLLLGITGAALAQSQPAGVPASEPEVERPAIAGRRIVKHFDFNERPLGNYERLPMQWRRHGDTGFPLFLEGKFDPIGHESPPSFRLDLDGGSIGYHYQGRDISVRTNSDYLVVAWVRTTQLSTARAYLTACYLDRKGILVPGTERRSNLIGEAPGGEWHAITVSLPGGIAGSRYIGVSVWLTQEPVWNKTPPPPHAVRQEEVRGTAWFDDITVYRLPRVALTSVRPSNVFRLDEPVELHAEVTDPDGLNLAATLTLRDCENRTIDRRAVTIHSDRASGFDTCRYADLPVGLYHAELTIATQSTPLVRRELSFIRVAPPISPPQVVGRGFGLVLPSAEESAFAAQSSLLAELHPSYVKLPVWTLSREPQEATGVRDYLHAVVEGGAEPIAVLSEGSLPASEREKPAAASGPASAPASQLAPRTLLDVLAQEPGTWKPLIAGTWARYAGLIGIWQVGSDGDDGVVSDPRLPRVLAALKREMLPLMSNPELATSASAHEQPPTSQPVDYHTAIVSHRVPAASIAEQIAPHVQAFPKRHWVLIEPPPVALPRHTRLLELGRRLVEASFANGRGVFMPAPWTIEPGPTRDAAVPSEDLIIFHTVSDVLGDATPVSRLVLEGQARCLIFDRNGRSVVFAWDPDAPPEGREHFLPLGPDAETVDLWGHRRPIPTVGGQQRLVIGPEPVFVLNAPTWMLEFLRQFRLDPPSVEFSYDVYERKITFRNTYREPITGLLRLVGPPDWDIRPNRVPFTLSPGQTFTQSVSLRFPINAEAGVLPLVGEFLIDADRRYKFQAVTWFELMLQDIDLQTYTFRSGDRLIVRQTMTNRTASPVSFQGYLIAPGRPRIERTFANFQPGQTTTKDFILENAAELSGRKLRVGLKEIQGTRVWNRIIEAP